MWLQEAKDNGLERLRHCAASKTEAKAETQGGQASTEAWRCDEAGCRSAASQWLQPDGSDVICWEHARARTEGAISPRYATHSISTCVGTR